MSSVYPLQQTFQQGIISPSVQGRSQTEGYADALGECVNWQLKPQGSIRYRNGSKFLRTTPNGKTKLFNFSRGDRDDLMVEVAVDGKIRLFDRDGNIPNQGIAANNLIRDAGFAQGYKEWDLRVTEKDSPVVGAGNTFINEWTPPTLAGQGVLLQGSPRDDRVCQYISLNQIINVDVGTEYTATCKFVLSGIGNFAGSGNVAPIFDTPFSAQINATRVFPLVGNLGTDGIQPTNGEINGGREYTMSFNFTPVDSQIEFGILGVYNKVISGGNTVYDVNLEVTELTLIKTAGGGEAEVEFNSPYTTEIDFSKIQVAQDTAKREMYFVHPDLPPYVLKENLEGIFTFEELLFSENSPDDQWRASGNWPAVVEIWQGRLILANTADKPSTIWFSAVNNFNDFSGGNTNASSLEFTLNTNGVIEWLRGSRVLLIGTDRALWTGGSTSGIIKADDFVFIEQSYLGTIGQIEPQRVGDQLAYVGRDSRRIRTVNFDADLTDGYVSQEVSLQADQLFDTRIVDMAYARDPDYQLAVITGDGKLHICLLDRVTGLQGWYTYQTNGSYKRVEYSDDPTGSSFYVVVDRNNNSTENPITTTIERFDASSDQTVHLDSWFLTNALTEEDEAGVGAYSNAFSSAYDGQGFNSRYIEVPSYYEGKTLQCAFVVFSDTDDGLQADEQYQHPDVYVYNGRVKLESYVPFGSLVSIGIGYKAKAATLPLEVGNRAGTGQATKRHFNRIFARIINDSTYPVLNGYRPIPENPDKFDILASKESYADVEIRNEGTLEKGIVTIEQDLPLNCEIACIFGKAVSKVT